PPWEGEREKMASARDAHEGKSAPTDVGGYFWSGRARRRGWPRLALALALAGMLECFGPVRAGAANFTATLDRETVPVGESATLTLSFEGGQPRSTPVPPEIPNLQITDTGSSTRVEYVNGQGSLTVSRT